jgi:glycosyltransferase involved in cell wall biosynthesis
MLHGKRVVVVMPAYHAEKTLAACHAAIPHEVVDKVVLVDDASDDATLAVAARLGIETHRHPVNLGYGANQKTCYRLALADGADIVVMLHPDYQYEPRLVTAMAAMVASDVYDVVIGSRILGNTALADAGIRAFVSGEQLTGGVGQLPAMDLVTVMVADPDVERSLGIAADIDARLSRGELDAIAADPYDDVDPLTA